MVFANVVHNGLVAIALATHLFYEHTMSYVKAVKRFFLRQERTKRVSAAEFLRLWRESPDRIKRVHVIPPQLGESGFGFMDVEFSLPIVVIENQKRLKEEIAKTERIEFV
jgi:hypothetical protein